jgi:UDP-N-acetylglucosamine 4,6-dehydratase
MLNAFLKNKVILITGGTGSFGKSFTKYLLEKCNCKKIIIFSRDELKQLDMFNDLNKYGKYRNKIRFFLGDVRDKERLISATKEVDCIVHAAALKQVPAAEYNPFEFVKTNVMGAQNIINAAIVNKVKKVIALSTDKACSPINFYGATKLCSDKLFISANNFKGKNKISFSVVRYGNVMGSRGSVIPFFLNLLKNNIDEFPITSKNMTRFNISLNESIEIVVWALKYSLGGEIFVPKIKSYRILDLAKSINNSYKIKEIGLRPGEKIHEELISNHDAPYTYDLGKYYAILNFYDKKIQGIYQKKGKLVKKNFSYSSYNNPNFLKVHELKSLIKKNVI